MFGAVSNKDLENIDKYFQQLIDFLSYEKNEFEYIESTGNKKVDDMFKRWNQQIKSFDKRAKDDKCIRRNNSDSQPIYIRTLCRS